MKQALLVIDVQNEYFSGKLPVTYPDGSLENILKAMDWAHASHLPVVVIQHTNLAPESPAFRKGTPGWELHDEIRRRHADIVIEKHLPGSFTGTSLEDWLKAKDITTVTIAGYMTQMCCDTTARQGIPPGILGKFPCRCDRHALRYQCRRVDQRCRSPPGHPCYPADAFFPAS